MRIRSIALFRSRNPGEREGRCRSFPVEERQGNFKEVELGYEETAGREEASRCLNCGYCCECYQCVAACGPHAVTLETHRQDTQRIDLEVGSVILAPGFVPFDPSRYETLSLCRTTPTWSPALEFERILSPTGPMGHLEEALGSKRNPRRSPGSSAWGRRDINQCDHGYCSSVCCMYAIKEAVIAKEHARQGLECAPFSSWTCGPTERISKGTTTMPRKSTGSASFAPGFHTD